MRLRSLLPTLFAASLAFGAGLDGTWIISTFDGEGRPVKAELTLRDEAGAMKALLKAGAMQKEIGTVARENDQVRFEIPWEDRTVQIQLALAGESLKGQWRTGDDVGALTGVRVQTGLAGAWKLTATRPNGETSSIEMELKNEGGAWQGTMRSGESGSLELKDLNVGEDAVQYTANTNHGPVQIQLKLQDGILKGTWALSSGPTGPIEGRR